MDRYWSQLSVLGRKGRGMRQAITPALQNDLDDFYIKGSTVGL